MRRWRLAPLVLASACVPTFDARPSQVDAVTVLAVVSEPPEARPGEVVTLRTVAASADGPVDALAEWSLCATAKKLGEQGAAPAECAGNLVRPIVARSREVSFAVVPEACSLFGPEAPPGERRARDPDDTGGYFMPVRVRLPEITVFGAVRITCTRSDVASDAARILAERSQPNQNPSVRLVDSEGAWPRSLPRGATLSARVLWQASDRERYVAYDGASGVVVDRSEAMRVAWYATRGAWTNDKTGRVEGDPSLDSANEFTAPSDGGLTHLWAVLRDSRGGTAVAHATLDVTP